MNNKYVREQIENNLKIVFNLEYLGVHIEDTKEERGGFGGLSTKTIYYFSVPESSILEVENKELNNRIKTSDGLTLVAKEALTDMIINSCKGEFPEDEEFIEDIRSSFSDYFKFYVKVREGEVWNKECGENRLKELNESIRMASGYKEV